MESFSFNLIVAYSFPSRGIGKDGSIQWTISEDLKWFARLTKKQEDPSRTPVVIMGRKTWESLPCGKLKDRLNIVLSKKSMEHSESTENGVIFCTFDTLIQTLEKIKNSINSEISVIGGGEIYKLFLESDLRIGWIYATEVYCKKEPEYDTVFPSVDGLKLVDVSPFHKNGESDAYFRFMTYHKTCTSCGVNIFKNKEETRYLDLMQELISAPLRIDRTGVGVCGLFGKQLTYDLSDSFPLSTTKKMFLRGIFEELMMYLRGQTDNNILTTKGIHVWDGNTTREFLDKRGLSHYKEGDMGSTYGFNFRHFGAEYKGCDASYTDQGVDQLKEVINLIKTDPTSRRLVINLWDPRANKGAALPACLCMYQFYVRESKWLDLQIYIRSSDYFLANNWNTCTGALLVHLICSLVGIELEPGILTVSMGDVHIYTSHLNQIAENLKRVPLPPPKLVVNKKKHNIEDFDFTDLRLIGYRSYDRIPAPMAV